MIKELSFQDQQNALQRVEKKILQDLKSWDFMTLLQHYRQTYVRGGRYQNPQRRAVCPELVIPYVQKWRSNVLAKALIHNYNAQVAQCNLDPSKPADKELQLLAKKS